MYLLHTQDHLLVHADHESPTSIQHRKVPMHHMLRSTEGTINANSYK